MIIINNKKKNNNINGISGFAEGLGLGVPASFAQVSWQPPSRRRCALHGALLWSFRAVWMWVFSTSFALFELSGLLGFKVRVGLPGLEGLDWGPFSSFRISGSSLILRITVSRVSLDPVPFGL